MCVCVCTCLCLCVCEVVPIPENGVQLAGLHCKYGWAGGVGCAFGLLSARCFCKEGRPFILLAGGWVGHWVGHWVGWGEGVWGGGIGWGRWGWGRVGFGGWMVG